MHPEWCHKVLNENLTTAPSRLVNRVGLLTRQQISDALKYKRKKAGVTVIGLYRDEIEQLIMRHGVTIDECAEKFNTTQRKICEVMGWV